MTDEEDDGWWTYDAPVFPRQTVPLWPERKSNVTRLLVYAVHASIAAIAATMILMAAVLAGCAPKQPAIPAEDITPLTDPATEPIPETIPTDELEREYYNVTPEEFEFYEKLFRRPALVIPRPVPAGMFRSV